MNEIVYALIALMHFRLVLSTVGSIALAFALSTFIPFFTAVYCVTLVACGFAFGLVWQSRADSGIALAQKTKNQEISKPVAFVGLAFIGLITGGFFAELFGSIFIGAVALSVCAALVALWSRRTLRPTGLRSFVFSLICLLVGYSMLLALAAWKPL